MISCECENKWLDEADYAVDTSTIPRGGHNRRKSMEPKMLANFDGNLVPSITTPGKQVTDASPTREFLNLSSITSRTDSIAPQVSSITDIPDEAGESLIVPATPTPAMFEQGGASFSPTTPYYMNQGNQLIQQTCPPKQSMQSLFPVSGDIDDQPDESVRQRLMLARRKSLQWAPKVGSPLGRPADFGKLD